MRGRERRKRVERAIAFNGRRKRNFLSEIGEGCG
jgi:hypothetical protein